MIKLNSDAGLCVIIWIVALALVSLALVSILTLAIRHEYVQRQDADRSLRGMRERHDEEAIAYTNPTVITARGLRYEIETSVKLKKYHTLRVIAAQMLDLEQPDNVTKFRERCQRHLIFVDKITLME